ncbi:hypothetical protein TNCT_591421, partial [Trichonephila clavata]
MFTPHSLYLVLWPFYYNNQFKTYPFNRLPYLPKYAFKLPHSRAFKGSNPIENGSRFLVLRIPFLASGVSHSYIEKDYKFVKGLPMTSRTQTVQSP